MVNFEVALARRVDHFFRKSRWWVVPVPPSRPPLCLEIVAERLLVEAWLRVTRFIAVRGPEARAVGGEHFIHQYNLFAPLTPSAASASKLELRVGDDDNARRRNHTAGVVNQARAPIQASRT